MRKRTKARQIALQFLYQVDLCGDEILDDIDNFLANTEASADAKLYSKELIQGCLYHWQEINQSITKVAKNWDISRMAVVDRTVLRIAVYELLYKKDVPQKVVINEAINLGKRFSTEHSGAFINGILDNLQKKFQHN